MNDKDRSIIAQVAAKVAGSMCMGKGREGIIDYLACAETVYNDIIDRVGDSAEPAAVPAAAAPPVSRSWWRCTPAGSAAGPCSCGGEAGGACPQEDGTRLQRVRH